MAKKPESDADFLAMLRASRQPDAKPPAMLLNKPPVGTGKSLDEMLQTESAKDLPGAGAFGKVALSLLQDSPFQPRLRYDEGYIQELSGSLQAVGQKEVITVRPAGAGFEIINGHCRARAARLAGWTEIDARIVAADDREAEVSALVQNETRKDLTDYERARLYRRALDAKLAKNQAAVARMFGCSEGRVSQALGMLDLPAAIQDFLTQHPALFGYRTAREILDLLKRHPGEEAILVQAVERLTHGAQAASVKAWVQQALSRKRGRPAKNEAAKITDDSGKLAFITKANARQVVVDVMPGWDPAIVRAWIEEELRKRATIPAPIPETSAAQTN
jgi:ParB family chromosome partitioning protein